MPWPDRLTPTAVWIVSRAWVVDEVAARGVDPQRQAVLVDELVVYEPPRRHGFRNTVIFWIVVFSAATLAGAIGFPKWTGFAVAMLFFIWVARELAVRALRWRLDQLLTDTQR